VLPCAYWLRVLGSDPGVIGQPLDLSVKKAQIAAC
jgi:hypothetical protein